MRNCWPHVYSILLLAFIQSCAWNIPDNDFKNEGEKKTDLVATFSQEKEIINKFKVDDESVVKDGAVTELEQVSELSSEKIKERKSQKNSKKKGKDGKVSTSINESFGTDEKVKESGKLQHKYPADYPAEFKKYDIESERLWKEFSPKVYVGEKMTFDIKYFNVTAGKIFLETRPGKKVGGRKAYHFHGRMISAPFYEMIYSLDDYVESYMDVETFIPLKYVLVQRESKQNVDDLQLFDSERLKTYYWYRREKEDVVKEEKKEEYIPRYIQDSLTPLFFMRGLPFEVGRTYEFPVVTRAKIWLVKILVAGVDKIKVRDKWEEAYRLKAETRFPGILSKKGDIIFWFSADEQKRFLKFEAKVKIGSLYGELVDYSIPES